MIAIVLFMKKQKAFIYLGLLLSTFIFIHCSSSTTANEQEDTTQQPPAALCNGVYVSNTNSLAIFATDSQGNIAPEASFESDPSLDGVRGLTCSGGEIFVTDSTENTIYVYDADETGTATPKRTLSGINTNLENPRGILVVADELFVTSSDLMGTGMIHVFDINDDGNVAPKRTLSGTNTNLFIPNFLAHFDGELFVSETQGNSILVFDTINQGNVAPKRQIDGMLTAIQTPRGIAVDGTNIYLADNSEIHIYDIDDNGGGILPNDTISGASTMLDMLGGLSVYNNEIYVANEGDDQGILVFSTTDTGDVAPTRVITGSNTQLDGEGLDVFVTNEQ
jgi:WD40 repeat protein